MAALETCSVENTTGNDTKVQKAGDSSRKLSLRAIPTPTDCKEIAMRDTRITIASIAYPRSSSLLVEKNWIGKKFVVLWINAEDVKDTKALLEGSSSKLSDMIPCLDRAQTAPTRGASNRTLIHEKTPGTAGAGKRFLVVSVEGRNRSRRHHVTISSNKHQDVNSSGHVTKIELELEEAPDDMILVGSMPSELDATGEINATYPDGIPGPSTVIVRAEEALIVILVLLLWAAAIALFFNRWGKIRMLEPYQPKFQQQHRQSCTTLEPNQLQGEFVWCKEGLGSLKHWVEECGGFENKGIRFEEIMEGRDNEEVIEWSRKVKNRRTYSKCNVLSGDYPAGYELNCVPGQMRPRQNSVFIGSSASLLPGGRGTPRRTKSAFDLQFLILSENNSQDSSCEQDTLKNFKVASESMKLLQRERRTSICQVDRTETIKSPFRDRGMSICHFDNSSKSCQPDRGTSFYQFDKMDVLARPLQRDRGGSICHFDRTDVLARSLHKDRIGSTYHFDRMDVLARPNLSLGKPLLRERRVSMCNFLEKDGEFGRYPKRERHLSVSNIDRIEKDNASIEKADSDAGGQKIFAECTVKENKNTCYQYDQPSCSKISDVVLGYKATCV
ncbi:hypothetical protein WH47_05047 [Habropoda laboriosa]|uniref:Fibronectin type III domain-containing protein n=1 Tax=Habropoda laboriosa TaxID=597456 RepID=A0A0L7RK88_9HYME|nr:hypothetical protein WH47_05047 [Habropoda laboriosa]